MRFFNRFQTSGAACKLALSIRAVLGAKTAGYGKCGASFYLAHVRVATAVSATETSSARAGGAVRHGARLLLVSTVSLAMRFFSRYQTSGAACKLACSTRAMFVAKTACCSKGGTAIHLAHFRPATAVFDAPSP